MYVRRYNHKGPKLLWDNLLSLIEEYMADELNGDYTVPDEYLKAHKPNFEGNVIVVEPDEDDTEEDDSGQKLNRTVVFNITLAKKIGTTPQEAEANVTGELYDEMMRRKEALWNVIISLTESELFEGITHTPAFWEVRGGAYRGGKVGNTYAATVRDIKAVFNYGEIHNA